MTQAAAAQTTVSSAPVVTDQVKIAYLDRAKQTVRLIFKTGFDKDHNLEYSYKEADVDSEIRTGDVPIDCVRQGEKLISLQFPPDQKPAPVQNPVSQAKPAEEKPAEQHKQDEEKPKEKPKQETKPVAPVDDGKWKIKLLKKDDGKALILTNTGKEEWFSYSGKAVEKIVRLKDGQLVKLKFENTTTFNDINPVDENGEYDKSGWGSGGGKGGGRPYDPEAEKRRQLLIVRQSCLDRAVQLWISVHAEHSGEIGPDQEQSITNLAEGFERWVMR